MGTAKQPRNLSECELSQQKHETLKSTTVPHFWRFLLSENSPFQTMFLTMFRATSRLASRTHFWKLVGTIWSFLGPLGHLLGTSWAPLRHLCPPLGAPWAPSGNIWPSLIASWVLSGRSWRHKRVLKPPTRPPKTPKASFYWFLTTVSSINTQTAFILETVVKNRPIELILLIFNDSFEYKYTSRVYTRSCR